MITYLKDFNIKKHFFYTSLYAYAKSTLNEHENE